MKTEPYGIDRTFAEFTKKMEQVVFHARVDYLRRQTRIEEREQATDIIPEVECPDFADNLSFEENELDEVTSDVRLIEAIRRLSKKEKAVIIENVINERPMEETAVMLGLSLSYSYKLRTTALNKLRKVLDKGGTSCD